MRKWVLLPGEHDALDERHDRHVTVHPTTGALDLFGPAAAGWFATTFAEPTPAQTAGWPTIASGDHTLILAPTGSGKTLSAFFWALDQLTTTPPPADRNHRTRLLYIPPLRALAVDIEKNLRSPLQRIASGIGNAYKSESLHRCRLDPRTPISTMTDADLRHVFETAHQLLRANLSLPGPRQTIDGGYAVYRRAERPGPRCRAPIVRIVQGNDHPRSTYWCPVCQGRPS